jgi:hypothetical protein
MFTAVITSKGATRVHRSTCSRITGEQIDLADAASGWLTASCCKPNEATVADSIAEAVQARAELAAMSKPVRLVAKYMGPRHYWWGLGRKGAEALAAAYGVTAKLHNDTYTVALIGEAGAVAAAHTAIEAVWARGFATFRRLGGLKVLFGHLLLADGAKYGVALSASKQWLTDVALGAAAQVAGTHTDGSDAQTVGVEIIDELGEEVAR